MELPPPRWIKCQQDFYSGLCLSAFALFMFWTSQSLPFGQGIYMGEGAAPRMISGALLVLGVVILVGGLLQDGPTLGRYPVRGLVFIIGAVTFFSLAISTLGFVITIFFTVLLGSAASRESQPVEALVWSAAVTGFCTVLFPLALRLPLALWPTRLF